jgi:uncharacterized phage protein gp47/JayE
MPSNFERPTPAQLIARVQSDIESEVDGVSAQVRRRPEHGHARAVAGVAHGLHGHLAWVAEQILPDQAAERFLLRWADLFGLSRKPATAASGTITVTGSGGTLPAGTEWLRVADGMSFTTDAEVAPVTSESVAITAAVGFEGAAGNLTAGTKLQLVSNIAGIDSEATVVSLAGGTDIESPDDLRDRLLDRIQRPPLGGAPGDHAAWALEVPGVDKAWEYAGVDGIGNPGAGKVAVTFVVDDVDNPIPDPDLVAEVQAYLDDRSPAQVIVFAPTPKPYNWHLVPVPDTVTDEITDEVKDMLHRDGEPGGVIRVSRFEEAVSAAAGETSHNTIEPTTDRDANFGELWVPGTATYTP